MAPLWHRLVVREAPMSKYDKPLQSNTPEYEEALAPLDQRTKRPEEKNRDLSESDQQPDDEKEREQQKR
jgi:hypothetical protein